MNILRHIHFMQMCRMSAERMLCMTIYWWNLFRSSLPCLRVFVLLFESKAYANKQKNGKNRSMFVFASLYGQNNNQSSWATKFLNEKHNEFEYVLLFLVALDTTHKCMQLTMRIVLHCALMTYGNVSLFALMLLFQGPSLLLTSLTSFTSN